jgi:hypothetical protein
MLSIDQLFIGCERPPKGCIVLEPFVGDGMVLKWIGTDNIIIPYDTDPKQPKVLKRDSLNDKPKYHGTYVYTRSPQLAKADSEDKTLFEKYGVDDLYKCFIKCLKDDTPNGGTIVVPTKFMTGIRDSEIKRRQDFFRCLKPLRFNVFDDNTLVINFRKRMPGDFTTLEKWDFHLYPENIVQTYNVKINEPQKFKIQLSNPVVGKYVNVTVINHDTKIDSIILSRTYTILDLELVTKEHPNLRAGLYKKGEHVSGCGIYIRGFLSKKLQNRLKKDFNSLLFDYRENKENKMMPATQMDCASATELIKSLILSYSQ